MIENYRNGSNICFNTDCWSKKDLNDFADSACDNEVIMILNLVVLGKPHHYSGMPSNMCALSEINEGKPAAKELSSLGWIRRR